MAEKERESFTYMNSNKSKNWIVECPQLHILYEGSRMDAAAGAVSPHKYKPLGIVSDYHHQHGKTEWSVVGGTRVGYAVSP